MDSVNRLIKAMKPPMEKISDSSYIRSIRDGYDCCVPVLLVGSILILITTTAETVGIIWPDNIRQQIWHIYNYSMGMLALLMAISLAKSLSDSMNNKLPKQRQLNSRGVVLVSVCCFLFLSVEPGSAENNITAGFMGTKGVLTAIFVAFLVPNINRFFVKRGFTFNFPEEVPNFVAQYFANLVPIGVTVVFVWFLGLAVKDSTGLVFAEWLFESVKPVFDLADTYVGISLIYGSMAAFFFVSIHGPTVIEPIVAAIFVANIDANLQTFIAGGHPTHILTHSTSHFLATMGGTGATFMFGLMCAFFARSKQLRTTGKISWPAGMFGVNEPLVFGAPLAMNPVFIIPFILTPVFNVCLLKYFVENLGMCSFIYILPWTTPPPLGIILGTGLDPMSFWLVGLVLTADVLIYLPFFLIHDRHLVKEEALAGFAADEQAEASTATREKFIVKDGKPKSVLAMCASGATSSMLAKTINRGAQEHGLELTAMSMGYGQHRSTLKDFDLVILAPQMASAFDELKHECDKKGVTAVTTSGAEYVAITRDGDKALEFVLKLINE